MTREPTDPSMRTAEASAERMDQPAGLMARLETPAPGAPEPTRRYATLTFMRGSIASLGITLVAGLLGILYYVPGVATVMQGIDLRFETLRPLHTTFAAAFIFLGGVAVVHRYLEDVAGPVSRGERLRLKIQVILWAVAGAGILVSLAARVFTGREYMGFHPVLSIPILLGWLLFAWNFLRVVRFRGFLKQPVYITMWTVGVLFFVYTFIEQHAWQIDGVFADPLVDMRIQWKATGTLVGSFNLFVYGAVIYIGERISRDPSYGHSRLAYALFGVGLGLVASQLANVTQSAVGEEDRSEVGGLQYAAQNLGVALGTALVGTVLLGGLLSGVESRVYENEAISPELEAGAGVALESGLPFVAADVVEQAALDAGFEADEVEALVSDYEDAQVQALRLALGVLALAAIIGVWFTRNLPGRGPVGAAKVTA